MRQVVSRLTSQEDEQQHNRSSNVPIPDPTLDPPSTPRSAPSLTPTPTPSSGGMQGQMLAALGGPEGMVAMTEAMQVAFLEHAHKARLCCCLLNYQATADVILHVMRASFCITCCLPLHPVSVCVYDRPCVQHPVHLHTCCICLGFCGVGCRCVRL